MGLSHIFKPRAVAVVGASRDPGAFGHRVLRCLVESGFQGPLYPVNPKAKVIHSFPCYPSAQSVPDPIDLAVIVVPARDVIKAVEDCARKGVQGVVVITAGFKETGPPGEALERRLAKIVRGHGMRMIGPNCMGVINTDPRHRLNATFAPASMTPGHIAFMSQSGAMGMAILNYARELCLGFSMYASVGNRADVSANDLLEFWRDDPDTRAILLYMESFGNPRRFTSIARTITAQKPIIAVKAGRTVSGALAADRHTGDAPAATTEKASDLAVDALFAQCGVLRVQTLEELFDLAKAVISQPLPRGAAVGVLTNGGGPGIMAADALEGLELEVPPLDPRTVDRLRAELPYLDSVRNPLDMRADADIDLYRQAIPAMLGDPNLDVLLIIYVGLEYGKVARIIIEQTGNIEKPVLVCLMGGRSGDPGIRTLQEQSIPVYSFPESACRVIAHLRAYQLFRERPQGKVKRYRNVDRDTVARLIKRAEKEGRTELRLDEVREVALAYGVKVPRNGMARTDQEAVSVAQRIGFPVVVKAVSERLKKKSEVGGVMLDLRTEAEVKRAFHAVMENVRARYASAQVEGVLVQQMVRGGQELIVGAHYDPIFGPVLKLGAGGIYADIIQDFQFRIVPITTQEALEMVRSLKIYPLLEGLRGRNPVHVPSLVDLLCRASQLIEQFEEIREFEINPLIVLPRMKDLWAVDGMMRFFRPEEMKERPGEMGTTD
ncbi:MAG TPA: acetate--CoA ligase family protein [bacterium]|nr:acetate--CoA ligase family protein [bacterium]